ncbi:serine/threonine-protein phosphatase 6 regulatory ankyrin repeat subunit C-like protein, partial [Tasmannia lanceolata]|uniref:serine/threonine-protein phosphatase 6 regulatory ankyrin repeat subunit C-like protein n=1 Tax=Tasmannia lanceolata TaxID=3420 RepID=UPI00406353A1
FQIPAISLTNPFQETIKHSLSDYTTASSLVNSDPIVNEENLVESVWHDDSSQLISLSKLIANENSQGITDNTSDKTIGPKILHLACKLDSVDCATALLEGQTGFRVHVNCLDGSGRTPLHNAAEMHSRRCVELLIRKNGATDFRSKDGKALLPIEIALSSKR